ncbi:lipopolysaccharide biosynthesis protein [Azospirillum sp. SYSU D00513]|uniref:oligosaccharide flippase family protein n=1 Tax=Azospirillum sp. SYSU D00513 TaxID=2812561 RepID=UPI001A97271F
MFTRTIRNAGWLLGGKGVGAVFSLIYLAMAARSLGLTAFGEFTLVLTYGQAVSNLVQFQSWQSVIRYGAIHLAAKQAGRLSRVLAFTILLDLSAAAAGALLAGVGVLAVGPYFGWSAEEQSRAALFGMSLLFGLRGTPTGVLRLFDRFDLAAYSETMLPTMRLVGATTVWLTEPSVEGFLVAWAVAELVTTAVMWTAASRELRRHGLRLGGEGPFIAGVLAENPGLWRFACFTNITTSINLVWQQVGVMAVGMVSGPGPAGGYRVAYQMAQALSKPSLSLARSVYPEFARLAAEGGPGALTGLLRRITLVAAGGGLIAVTVVTLAGEHMLTLVAGPEFAFAHGVLILLTTAAALDLCGFGLEPAATAAGRPGLVLAVRAFAGVAYLAALSVLLNLWGITGAASSAVLGSGLFVTIMAVLTWRVVRAAIRAAPAQG